MQHPSLATIFWQLRSAEESHAKYGDKFWIPTLAERQNIKRGQAARLIFDIQVDKEGELEVKGERMYVIVSEKVGDTYIGILDNQPAYVDPEDNFCLSFGAEIPFLAKHVIDIDFPPQDWVEQQLSHKPTHRWPRA